jgi:rhodanese-related sulfurtransferase
MQLTTKEEAGVMRIGISVLAVTAICALGADALACDGCGCQAAAKPKAECKAACAAAKTACESCPAKAGTHGYTKIDTDGLDKLIQSGEEFVLIDARSGKYDDGRRIGSAKQLAATASEEEIAKALPNKDAKIVAYCSSKKCPASAMLLDRLATLGYKDLVKYPDGIGGWADAGKPVKK